MSRTALSPDDAFRLAETLEQQGKRAEAETLYRRIAAAEPGQFRAPLRLGAMLEMQGRLDPALDAYAEASRRCPGLALPFTRRALIQIRRAWGPPKPPRRRIAAGPRITMSTLGANGRFGNQLLQYGFLRMYGAVHGLTVEAPDWIGRDLFDLDDPTIAGSLPLVSEQVHDLPASLNKEIAEVHTDRDLWGYCCYPTGRIAAHRAMFQGLFRPGARLQGVLDAAMPRLRARGTTLVALHLRRGDFGYGRFWIAPERWYLDWLEAVWPAFEKPVLYIATDDAATAAAFADYRPVQAADLGVAIPGADFYLDFHILRDADAVAISNSTFSFVASMLNARARTFVRPERAHRALVAFDPWNAEVLI